tara:strand:+ start:98 stop:292 length:195 start_codon:yes stop_codon:yes gene_type:complete
MKDTTEDGKEIKSFEQRMYRVGFGSNMWGIISEDSLDRYSNIVGLEPIGTRKIYYIEEEINYER